MVETSERDTAPTLDDAVRHGRPAGMCVPTGRGPIVHRHQMEDDNCNDPPSRLACKRQVSCQRPRMDKERQQVKLKTGAGENFSPFYRFFTIYKTRRTINTVRYTQTVLKLHRTVHCARNALERTSFCNTITLGLTLIVSPWRKSEHLGKKLFRNIPTVQTWHPPSTIFRFCKRAAARPTLRGAGGHSESSVSVSSGYETDFYSKGIFKLTERKEKCV
ncbi:hypothetical protein ANN_23115 [Periplaneta americana]|uniref:Uncharacterized protein n=1 Tax=Periplaneta americana TaxID=6978 RepID=A0ABQ8SKK5_PERAM|nr:hypothetical protein ANN_23115 [Periplaneta americana]